VNETRPGVTSAVLSPGQALEYLKKASSKIPNLAVVGIAGPGDPFANADETLKTLELVKNEFPQMLICVATNGLSIMPYIDKLKMLNVSHVTITINAVNPAIGAKIYSWVKPGKFILRGEEGAGFLIKRQLDAVEALKKLGITVKINTIIIPGINDNNITEVAESVKALGADIMNCMPLYPAEGTEFEKLGTPPQDKVLKIRNEIKSCMPQMNHCTRCRADAAGLLGAPMAKEITEILMESKKLPLHPREKRPFIALASREGVLVNQHLGEATELWIFGKVKGEISLIEKRNIPLPGGGDSRWKELAEILKDCRLLLAAGAGANPTKILDKHGIEVVLMEGMINEALLEAFGDGNLGRFKIMWEGCGSGCSGKGQGCG
jgi:nitrogen fixation protein NifB